MASQTRFAELRPHPGVLPEILDESALAALDEAASGTPIDDELLRFGPSKAIRTRIQQIVGLLGSLNLKAFLDRQGWHHRITGADIEAKLMFELAAHKVTAALDDLRLAANRGRVILEAIVAARENTIRDQDRLELFILAATDLLKRSSSVDAFLRSRFERRLANLITMRAANDLAIQQFLVAENNLKALLDRYTDIDTVVVPLWQRNAFAIVHATNRLSHKSSEVKDFSICHSALKEYFEGEARS